VQADVWSSLVWGRVDVSHVELERSAVLRRVPVKVNMVWVRMSGHDGKLPGAVTDMGCRELSLSFASRGSAS
jgi:hypothetical protein